MEEIIVKIDIPPEFKEKFELALDKVVKEFVKNLQFSIIEEISEIPADDKREVKESVVKEVIASVEETAAKLDSGEIHPISLSEFNKWCE